MRQAPERAKEAFNNASTLEVRALFIESTIWHTVIKRGKFPLPKLFLLRRVSERLFPL